MSNNLYFKHCEQNVLFKIASSLNFQDRYNFCLSYKLTYNNIFKKYQHPEVISIEYWEHENIDKFPNVKFKCHIAVVTNKYLSPYRLSVRRISLLSIQKQNNIIKKLIKLHRIQIIETRLKDFSIFKNTHNVTIIRDTTLCDLSCFINVDILTINTCINVRNIPYLQNLYALSLINIKHINNITNIKHINAIIIMDCHGITDFSPLKNVNKLNIQNCDGLVDISPLKNINELSISYCKNVKNYHTLTNVKKLYFNNDKIKDISFGKTCTIFIIIHCDNIYDISLLANSKKLKHLIIFSCDNIKKLPIFNNLEKLTLIYMNNVDCSNLKLSPNLKCIEKLNDEELVDEYIDNNSMDYCSYFSEC